MATIPQIWQRPFKSLFLLARSRGDEIPLKAAGQSVAAREALAAKLEISKKVSEFKSLSAIPRIRVGFVGSGGDDMGLIGEC